MLCTRWLPQTTEQLTFSGNWQEKKITCSSSPTAAALCGEILWPGRTFSLEQTKCTNVCETREPPLWCRGYSIGTSLLTDTKTCSSFVPYRHDQQCAFQLGCASSKGWRVKIHITLQNTTNTSYFPVRKNIWYASLSNLATVLAWLGTSGPSLTAVCMLYISKQCTAKWTPYSFRMDGFFSQTQSTEQDKLVRAAYVHQSTGNVFYITCTNVVFKGHAEKRSQLYIYYWNGFRHN